MDLPSGDQLLAMNRGGMTYQKMSEIFGVTRNAIAGRIDRTKRRAIGTPFASQKADEPDLEYTYNPEMILTVPVHKGSDVHIPAEGGFKVSTPDYLSQPRPPIIIDPQLTDLRHERYKPCVLDIETTDFSASDGSMNLLVCAVIAPLNKSDGDQAKIFSLTWEDTSDQRGIDYRLLQEVIGELNKWDVIIGHNVGRFDINWLLSRVMMQYHGLPPRAWQYFDTLSAARSLAWLGRKGLAPLCASLKIPAIKTGVQKATWAEVYSPRRDEFEYTIDSIVFHCLEDVKANRILFDYLYPYAHTLRDNPTKLTKWRVGVFNE